MANTTTQVRIGTVAWGNTTDRYPSPAGAATYYQNAMVGQDASGNLQKLDDTKALLFIGLIWDAYGPQTDSTDSAGAISLTVQKPWLFSMPIAAATEGDEGKKVWAAFDNTVQYIPGSHANYVGKVYRIKSATEVWIAPPWSPLYADGGSYNGFISAAAAAGTTLSQFDVNKIVEMPLTSSENITLPAVTHTSPGDRILFVNTSSNSSTPTLVGAGSDNINGANTFAMPTTQYAVSEAVSDGTQWFIDVPSATIGGTSFTGAVTVQSAAATSFAVGLNGGTHPAFQVDDSTATSATGVKFKSAAAGGGFAIVGITSGTNENMTLDTAGSGTFSFNSVSGTGDFILGDAINLRTGTSTGTKIGTATTQKLALWNATPIVQPANTVDYVTGLVNVGLRASGGTASATFPGLVSVGTKLGIVAFTGDVYGSAMTIDVTKGYHVVAASHATSATATLTPSAAGTAGDLLTIVTETDSGGTCTLTFASTFHSSGTQACTLSTFSSIVFQSDGTRWVELCRTTALS